MGERLRIIGGLGIIVLIAVDAIYIDLINAASGYEDQVGEFGGPMLVMLMDAFSAIEGFWG